MKKSYRLVSLAAVAVLAMANVSLAADDVKPPEDGGSQSIPGPYTGPNCDLTGYKSETISYAAAPVAIPDNNAAGVLLGPMNTPLDGTRILDTILSVNITHTWLGDIKMTLTYDVDCDGQPEASTNVLWRAGNTICQPTSVGCSSNLIAANTYSFSDEASSMLNPTTCTSTVNLAGGCYRPSGPSGTGCVGTMSAFNGYLKGGCFRLFLSDNASLDTGTISSWTVNTLNEVIVPVESATWGTVKALYR